MEDQENIQNSDSLNEQYIPKVQGEMIFEKAMQVMPIPQALQNTQSTMVSSNPNQTGTNTVDSANNQTSNTKDTGK